MSLIISLTAVKPVLVHQEAITHNLGPMANALGVAWLWNLGEKYTLSSELIRPLEAALDDLSRNPDKYEKHEAKNGWGTVADMHRSIDTLLTACKENPNAVVKAYK